MDLFRLTLLAVIGLLIVTGCAKPEPRISNFDSNEVVRAVAYRYPDGYYGDDLEIVMDPLPGRGSEFRVVPDSMVIDSIRARELVFDFNRGEHYVQGWETDGKYYGVLCHYPRFIVQFYDHLGRRSNYFSFCDECGNARMTNYADYPKRDEYTLSEYGLREIFRKRDELFGVAD